MASAARGPIRAMDSLARDDIVPGHGRIPWDEIVLAVLGLRILVTAVGVAVRVLLHHVHQSTSPFSLLLDPWRQFDAIRFSDIAAHGYQAGSLNTAYMPMYPLVMRVASVFTGGHYLAAGMLVSTIACVFGTGLLWRWVADRFSEPIAWRCIAIYLLFPDAFYLMGAYSESLFLAFSAGCLLASSRDRPVCAGLLGSLAVLTRLQGLVLVVPLAFDVRARYRDRRSVLIGVSSIAALPIVLAAYQKALTAVIGGSSIVDTFQSKWHIKLQPPWDTIRQYIDVIRSPQFSFLQSHTANYVMVWDLAVGLLVLVVLALGWHRLGHDVALFGLASWCFSLSRWYSTGRYMLAVLPFFIAVALWAGGRRLKYVTMVSLLLLVFFASQFAQGSWID
jgi:hypothetical protein